MHSVVSESTQRLSRHRRVPSAAQLPRLRPPPSDPRRDLFTSDAKVEDTRNPPLQLPIPSSMSLSLTSTSLAFTAVIPHPSTLLHRSSPPSSLPRIARSRAPCPTSMPDDERAPQERIQPRNVQARRKHTSKGSARPRSVEDVQRRSTFPPPHPSRSPPFDSPSALRPSLPTLATPLQLSRPRSFPGNQSRTFSSGCTRAQIARELRTSSC